MPGLQVIGVFPLRRIKHFFLFGLAWIASPTAIAQTSQEWIQDHVRGYEEPFTLSIGGKPLRACPALVVFYQSREYRPAWSEGQVVLPRAHHLVQALKAAPKEGLNLADYPLARIENTLAKRPVDPVSMAELDILLTQTFLTYASHLGGWRVDQTKDVDPEWHVRRSFLDLPTTLESAIASDQIEETLFGLLPTHPDYSRLKDALVRYRAQAAAGGFPRIDGKGRSGGLRARLAAEGYLSGNESEAVVRQAVKSFQRAHGQEPTGSLNGATVEALNVPASTRVHQIETNLERWRWLPHDLGKRHIMVNVPGYDLKAVDDGHTVLTMRVVVGKPYLRTPAFNAQVSYLVINPYWNVPPSIAGKELLPMLRKDPSYLSRHNMVISRRSSNRTVGRGGLSGLGSPNSPYLLRQRPGPKNPLGTIKFMFPNPFNVYLHDTSQRQLFARTERVFSHGCIRIEKPAELLEYVLGPNSRWNRKTLKSTDRSKEHIVSVPHPVPVHILYWTAWADEDGRVQFRKDIYGRDKLLEAAISPAPVGNNKTESNPKKIPVSSSTQLHAEKTTRVKKPKLVMEKPSVPLEVSPLPIAEPQDETALPILPGTVESLPSPGDSAQ
ncbi:L,D-transpeptidase YcbB [Gammaproteobacteria bacterium]